MTMETKFSTLWIIVVLNMGKADILSLYIPGIHEELLAFAGTTPITQLMLYAAIIIQIPIGMIFLSRILRYKINRWANIFASVITIVFIIGGGTTTPHYIFIAAIETVCLLLIIWFAWRWKNPKDISALSGNTSGLQS